MKTNQKQKSIVLLVVSGLLVATSLVGTWYTYSTMTSIKSGIQVIRDEIGALEAENDSIRDFQFIRSNRADDIDRINSFFIEQERPLAFIESVESLGRTTRNVLVLGAESNLTGSGYFTFRITVEGERKNALRFLSLIETMPYQLYIETYDLTTLSLPTPGLPDSEKTRLAMTIKVKTK